MNNLFSISSHRPCKQYHRLLIVGTLVISFVIAGCTSYERSNPFDPLNPQSQRDLTPVVMSFLYNDGTGSATSNAEKAYAAYRQIASPAIVLSFDLPLTGSTTPVDFLKTLWEPGIIGPRPLPRVFVGSDTVRLVGIASTTIHRDSINAQVAPLRNKTAYWTIEGKATVADSRHTLSVSVARLGNQADQSIRIIAFAGESQTESWIKVTHVFNEQTIDRIDASEVVKYTFSGDLGAEAPLHSPAYAVILVDANGTILQGVSFE